MSTVELINRRTVRGQAFKECEFCGREKYDNKKQRFNYQYIDENTDRWDTHVFCSKACYSAWHCMNAGQSYLPDSHSGDCTALVRRRGNSTSVRVRHPAPITEYTIMPIWDFYCMQCGTTKELLFPSYAASCDVKCPTCGSALIRQDSRANFVVNGYNAQNLYSKKS